jgi:hypothetical protein
MASPLDRAGRTIAGLIGYDPGPGIYSRLERAVQGMPANVRVEEIPGLLKRYKDGVPGWELKETDFPGLVGDSKVIPRQDLLDRVRERSPVYTHGEVILGGKPVLGTPLFDVPVYQDAPSKLGRGVSHGDPHYESYSQGGEDYAELLLLQPGQSGLGFGSHWSGRGAPLQDQAVAHARYDTHGDALRINELQSDLGIHNRKMREAGPPSEYAGGDGPFDFMPPQSEEEMAAMRARSQVHPFPLEDAWSDLLIKRLALEAARGGHRAIEIASPRAIADKVGGNIENYEHFYGKVVPGAIERLGRKMGGMVEDAPALRQSETKNVWDESEDLINQYRRFNQGDPEKIDAFNDLLEATSPATQRDAASKIYAMFDDGDPGYATAVTRDAIALPRTPLHHVRRDAEAHPDTGHWGIALGPNGNGGING